MLAWEAGSDELSEVASFSQVWRKWWSWSLSVVQWGSSHFPQPSPSQLLCSCRAARLPTTIPISSFVLTVVWLILLFLARSVLGNDGLGNTAEWRECALAGCPDDIPEQATKRNVVIKEKKKPWIPCRPLYLWSQHVSHCPVLTGGWNEQYGYGWSLAQEFLSLFFISCVSYGS